MSQPDPVTSPLTDEQLEALKSAVYLAGGAREVARRMGYLTGESIRRFCTGDKPVPAEKCRQFRDAIGRRLTLRQIRPDLFAGLTVDALGYKPRESRA